MMNAWALLAIAIVFEIAGTSLLKASDGFVRWGYGMASIACYWVCFGFLAAAIKTIPVGVAYAIWSGIGILAIAIIGWIAFRQPLSVAQIAFIALILIGAVGLNLSTPQEEPKASSSQSSA
jgi:small multidrug resistance pump